MVSKCSISGLVQIGHTVGGVSHVNAACSSAAGGGGVMGGTPSLALLDRYNLPNQYSDADISWHVAAERKKTWKSCNACGCHRGPVAYPCLRSASLDASGQAESQQTRRAWPIVAGNLRSGRPL